jgi:hypothetical protein
VIPVIEPKREEVTEDFLRAWTTDAFGYRVRVGLTKKETEEYESLRHLRISNGRLSGNAIRTRFLQLRDMHEAARRLEIEAERRRRGEKEPRVS